MKGSPLLRKGMEIFMLLFTSEEERKNDYGKEKQSAALRSLSGYKKKVCRSMRSIRQAYKHAQADEAGLNRISIKWVLTNHYAIDESFRTVFQNLNPHIKVPVVRLSGRKTPRICCLLRRYLEDHDYLYEEKTLFTFLESLDFSLLENEICVLYAILVGMLIRKISASLYIESETAERMVGHSIQSLFRIKDADPTVLYETFSPVEQVLLKDPAGTYPRCVPETKETYRRAVRRMARRTKKSPYQLVSELYGLADSAKSEKRRNIGWYLLRRKRDGRLAYFTSLLALFAIPFGGFFLLCREDSLWLLLTLGLLLILPIYALAKSIADMIFSSCYHAEPVPKIEMSSIPAEAKTLVVITTLLMGKEKDAALFDRLEAFYLRNREEYAAFGILGDFKEANSATQPGDDEFLSYARARLSALNGKYGDRFYLFVRKRTYCAGEKKFMGWERKRGAVVELVRYLKGLTGVKRMTSLECSAGDESFLRDTRYVLTLDADTDLTIGAVREMASVFLHPLNKPEIDPALGRVTSGHAILQPKMSTSLSASQLTHFTRLYAGVSGNDIYASAAFDIPMNLFGEGIFCGKGMFDVDAFYELLDNAFPEETVLSHDFLEGLRLRTAYVPEIELTDSIPRNPLSFYDRMHRWVRGDVQALRFSGRLVRNAENRKISNPIGKTARFLIRDNIRRALCAPSAALALILLAMFPLPHAWYAVLCATAYLWFPLAVFLCSHLLKGRTAVFCRRFSSKVPAPLPHILAETAYQFCSLAYQSTVTVDAVFRALFRMVISHRHMLAWVTAGENDARQRPKHTIWLHYRRMWISVLVGALLLLFGFFPGKLLGAVWMLAPAVFASLSRPLKPIESMKEDYGAVYERYAADIWKYFERYVTEEDQYLPPDNIQLIPELTIAHRTSPTNIGLYLMCILAARDFSFLSSGEMYERLDRTLSTVERLEKWKGHLYNWYDTVTLELLGEPYISTVDSGNFICTLICLKEGIKSYIEEDTRLAALYGRIEKLISNTDFRALYHEKKALFYLGYQPMKAAFSENYYDFHMSEARSASYYAVSAGIVPKKNWRMLSRKITEKQHRIGCLSWTGTAFEYFMPCLWLPTPKGSFIDEALSFAYEMQRQKTIAINRKGMEAQRIYGVSESAFFEFDREMNYQYRAFGVQSLGLKRGLNRDAVIAPYASFLMLVRGGEAVPDILKNLQSIEHFGAYGKFGFYDALDFTKRRVGDGAAIVRSFMAHHLGMSMAALANARFDHIFQRRFFGDPQMAAGRELLEEKVPVEARAHERNYSAYIPDKVRFSLDNEEKTEEITGDEGIRFAVLSNTQVRLLATNVGHVYLEYGKVSLTYPDFSLNEPLKGLQCLFCTNGRTYPVTAVSGREEGVRYTFSSSVCTVRYTARYEKDGVEASVVFQVYPEKNMIEAAAEISGVAGEVRCLLYFQPVLAGRDYHTHPAFSKLFLEAEYDAEEGMLCFRRRKRETGAKEYFLIIKGLGGESAAAGSAEGLIRAPLEKQDIEALLHKTLKVTSPACIEPLAAYRITADADSSGRASFVYHLSAAHTKERALEQLAGEEDRESMRTETCGVIRKISGLLPSDEPVLRLMLAAVCLGKVHPMDMPDSGRLTQHELWRHGISGDYPIITAVVSESRSLRPDIAETVSSLIRSHKHLTVCGIPLDLIFIIDETDSYYSPVFHDMEELIEINGMTHFKNNSKGIFLLNRTEKDRQFCELLSKAAECSLELSGAQAIADANESLSKMYRVNFSADRHIVCTSDSLKRFCGDTAERVPVLSEMDAGKDPSAFTVEGGSFQEGGSTFVVEKKKPCRPWSYLLTSPNFGTLLTQNSLGCTWYENASKKRLTAWTNDPYTSENGERILLRIFKDRSDKTYTDYDLCALSNQVKYKSGAAVYSGEIFDGKHTVSFEITVTVARRLYVKGMQIHLTVLKAEGEIHAAILYAAEPVLGESLRQKHIIWVRKERSALVVFNGMEQTWKGCDMLIFMPGESAPLLYTKMSEAFPYKTAEEKPIAVCGKEILLKNKDCYTAAFTLGAACSSSAAQYIYSQYNTMDAVQRDAVQLTEEDEKLTGVFRLKSPVKALDMLFNEWLPRQTLHARLNGRCGFYQSSGAYGFRDQLQDVLSMIYLKPETTAAQIYRCAAHQYLEGDVQHWWHEIKGDRPESYHMGIRTRYSDDLLWLPYAVAEYVTITGDEKLLSRQIRYLQSPELKPEETERFEYPTRTEEKESVYMHCVRALERSFRFGSHGLPLIGGGDWNDGMNHVGIGGKGESVWLAMFQMLVIQKFLPLCELQKDYDGAEKYREIYERLKNAVNASAFNGSWYMRGFYDDGSPLGDKTSDECRIDLLPQAFAAIVNEADNREPFMQKHVDSALAEAISQLWCPEARVFRLFAPSFDKTTKDPGYIKGYLPGIRENGGQYTHAAVWGIWGLFAAGKDEEAFTILKAINPIDISCDAESAERYQTEPYVLCGDVSYAEGHEGRGGWSWYTGAASWYYKIVLEQLLGYREEKHGFSLRPRLCGEFTDFQLEIRKKETVYLVKVSRAKEEARLTVDGKVLADNTAFPLPFDGGRHEVDWQIA